MISHLRMIHFSIVIVSGIIIYSLLSADSAMHSASEQLDAIIEYVDSQDRNHFPNTPFDPDNFEELKNWLFSPYKEETEWVQTFHEELENESKVEITEGAVRNFLFNAFLSIYLDRRSLDSSQVTIERDFNEIARAYKDDANWGESSISMLTPDFDTGIPPLYKKSEIINSEHLTISGFWHHWSSISTVTSVPDTLSEIETAYVVGDIEYSNLSEVLAHEQIVRISDNGREELYSDIKKSVAKLEFYEWCSYELEDNDWPIGGSQREYEKTALTVLSNHHVTYSLCNEVREAKNGFQSIEVVLRFSVFNKPVAPLKEHIKKASSTLSALALHKGHTQLNKVINQSYVTDTTTLKGLKLILDEFKTFYGGSVNVFGMGVPLTTVAYLGPLVLVAMQIYFVLHYRTLINSLKQSNHAKIRSPWIGLYTTSKISMTIFFITITLLPCLAMATPLLTGFIEVTFIRQDWLNWNLMGCLLSILISFWTAKIQWKSLFLRFDYDVNEPV